MIGRNDDEPVIMVPADLDVEDRIVGPVTSRLAGWLAAGAAGIALAALCWPNVPVTVLGGLAALAGLAGGFARPGRRPLAWWTRPVIAYLRRARTRADAGRHEPRARRRVRPDGAAGSAAGRGIRTRLRTRPPSDQARPTTTDMPAKPAGPPPTAAPAAAPAPDPASAEPAPPRVRPSRSTSGAGRWPRGRRGLVAAGVLALGIVAGVGGRQLIAGTQPVPAPRSTPMPLSPVTVPPAPVSPPTPPPSAQTPRSLPPAPWWSASTIPPRDPSADDPFWFIDPFAFAGPSSGTDGLGPDGLSGGGTGGVGDPPPAFPWWWAWGGDCGC